MCGNDTGCDCGCCTLEPDCGCEDCQEERWQNAARKTLVSWKLTLSELRVKDLEGEVAAARVRQAAERERRAFSGVKSGSSGWTSSVTAVVSSLNVVDRDSDLVLPGSLATRSAYVSEWNHSAMKGDAPVGSAILHEDGDKLIARITFDDTPRGRRACQRVFDERPDWSVGYDVVKDREPTDEEAERGVRRVIELWAIKEVSPVDRGAGVSTGTHSACCGSCASEIAGLPPAVDVGAVAVAVGAGKGVAKRGKIINRRHTRWQRMKRRGRVA